MIEIIPAILPTKFEEIEEKAAAVVGAVPLIQLDVCDGIFVPSKSWPYAGAGKDLSGKGQMGRGQERFQKIIAEDEGLPQWEELEYEIDLMVSEPTPELLDQWVATGAVRLVIHIESVDGKNLTKLIQHVEGRVAIGLAIGVNTPVDVLLPHLEDIATVQFMGIERIGYQGEPFAGEKVLDKIRTFHGAHPEVPVSVDGGVTLGNALTIVEAGASHLVCGSSVFGADSPIAAIKEFKKIV